MDELTDSRLAETAAAMADRTRARMLGALLDGRERTATDLATIGEVTPSTASSHLSRLEASHLIVCTPRGKRRYYRISGELAASAVESLLRLAAEPRRPQPRSVRSGLRFARTCYDHAAGVLGVAIHDRLLEVGWIVLANDSYEVTPYGVDQFKRWDIDCDALQRNRRAFARPCLDWSERRSHLAGALGAAVLDRMLSKRWVERAQDGRALEVRSAGYAALANFGVKFPESARNTRP